MLQNCGDQPRIDHRHLFRGGGGGAVCLQAVVRFPEFEQKFDLPPRAVEHDHGLPREHLGLAVGHEDRPVLPLEIVPRWSAAMLLGLLVDFLSPPVGHFLGHPQCDQSAGQTMCHAEQNRHIDRPRPRLLPQVLQQGQGMARGVEDQRPVLQPRDPKSAGLRILANRSKAK